MGNKIIITILLFNCIVFYVNAVNEIKNVKTVKDLSLKLDKTELGRTRRRPFGHFGHGIGSSFGIHALAILYWLKVKAVIISFIIGTAIVWGARYFWAQKTCPKEIIQEGTIIPFDHGPAWSSPINYHDHSPYSSAISYSDHDPYSSYKHYSDAIPTGPTAEQYVEHNPQEKKWTRKARSVKQLQNVEDPEEQISEMFFYFLGVGSNACRKRFVCEWEFKALGNPITRMAFRIIGRGAFTKYIRNPKDENSAKSFDECAKVNSECTIIEEDIENSEISQEIDQQQQQEQQINTDPIASKILFRSVKV